MESAKVQMWAMKKDLFFKNMSIWLEMVPVAIFYYKTREIALIKA